MRDLASIVTVASKGRMYQKDKICVVTFKENGYEAIVPVTVNVGDQMVFIQEGAILPEIERWEFLRKRCYSDAVHGFIIRPMTLGAKDNHGEKGDPVKSWGLCVTPKEAGLTGKLKSGMDVTDKLNIRKYEPADDASPKNPKVPKIIKFFMRHKLLRPLGKLWFNAHKIKTVKDDFPSDIIMKSDETTIQNCPKVLTMFPGTRAYITAKMEGQSFTTSIDLKCKKFYVCSRNNRFYTENESSAGFFETAKYYDVEKKLRKYYKDTGIMLVLQGEQVGPGIQGNIYNFDRNYWYVFRMKGHINGKWVEYSYPKMSEVAEKLGIPCVPLIEVVQDMGKSYPTIDSLVKKAESASWKLKVDKGTGKTSIDLNYIPKQNDKMWKNYMQHEGIVVKSADYNKEAGTGFSFKVKNLAYAEKQYTTMHELARNLK